MEDASNHKSWNLDVEKGEWMTKVRERIEVYPAIRYKNGTMQAMEEPISEEKPLTIYLNGKEIVTMLCSPQEEKQLAIGFLVSEGMITDIKNLSSLTVDEERGMAWVEADHVAYNVGQMYLKRCLTACCGRGHAGFYFANDARATKQIESQMSITPQEIVTYTHMLEAASATHDKTHGVHSGALAAGGQLLIYSEDIGRHNIFDKIYGRCLLEGVATTDKVIVFSGRVSSEILLKVSKMGVAIVIARSVPTTLALEMARELGITLIGGARDQSFYVYTHAQRVDR